VQAPRRRVDRRPPPSRRSLVIAGLTVAGLALVVLAVAFVSRSGGGGDAAAAVRAAGCTYTTYPATNADHVPPTKKVKYNSFPPTSGPMTEETVVWGPYSDPVGQMSLVHNLEHGGVAIEYGPKVNAATVARLNDFYQQDANGLVLTPLPGLGVKIALAAWNGPESSESEGKEKNLGRGILAVCPRFDREAFEAFRDAHRYKGPERFPRESLEPGVGH
jgi:hypothetical protein